MSKALIAYQEGYLLTPDVAKALGVSPKRLRGFIRAGLLPTPDLCQHPSHWGYSRQWLHKARPMVRKIKKGAK